MLPVMLLVIAIAAQPACLLYTRTVMQAAAAEGCRLVSTSTSKGTAAQSFRAYVLRRLAAVPDVDVFHVGGDDGWSIDLEGSQSSHSATVSIKTAVRPLPLLGIAFGALGQTDGSGNIVLCVTVSTKTRPDWLEGGYDAWSSIW